MEKKQTKTKDRVIDSLVMVFMIVVMMLLAFELGTNTLQFTHRSHPPAAAEN